MKVTEIESLIKFIAKANLDEVSIETEQIKLSAKKNVPLIHRVVPELPNNNASSMTTLSAVARPVAEVSSTSTNPYVEFKAPMVGTFYQSPKPDASPFVRVGDQIQPGQKLCIIEAMKLFNEIEADMSGTIVEVLIEDASPVEYDQPLFRIDPRINEK
mmetsp:Transcript_10489/g.24301  ORF Transcript_10489/g.24301 Transcript_10489/m.24301 type:complete len:158 (-) Transcript_10489:2712-3185(-)